MLLPNQSERSEVSDVSVPITSVYAYASAWVVQRQYTVFGGFVRQCEAKVTRLALLSQGYDARSLGRFRAKIGLRRSVPLRERRQNAGKIRFELLAFRQTSWRRELLKMPW